MSKSAGFAMIFVAGMAIVLSTAFAGGEGEDDNKTRRIDELMNRVRILEDSLGTSTYGSFPASKSIYPSVITRLKKTEDGLFDIQRAFREAGPSLPDRVLTELKREIQDVLRSTDALTGRLTDIERDLRRRTDVSEDIQKLKSDMTSLTRDLKSVEQRITTLERAK